MGLKCVAVGKLGPSMTVHGDKTLTEIGCEDLRGRGGGEATPFSRRPTGYSLLPIRLGWAGGGGARVEDCS
jgi:hypothetical protein